MAEQQTHEGSANRAQTYNQQRSNHETANTQPQIPDERALEELQYYRGFLNQLLGLIHDGDQATVDRVFSVIRSGALHQEILAAMSEVPEVNGQTNGEENTTTRG